MRLDLLRPWALNLRGHAPGADAQSSARKLPDPATVDAAQHRWVGRTDARRSGDWLPRTDILSEIAGKRGRGVLEVTIVIPTFNESRRIASSRRCLELAIQRGSLCRSTTEVIFVDDGSTDGTSELLKQEMQGLFEHLVFLRLESNRGKGAAIRFGVLHARAPITVYMDFDMAVDPLHVPALIAPLDDVHVTLGSRSLKESVIKTNRTSRVIRGKVYSGLANAMTSVNLKDTQCGFKAFRTPVAKLLFVLSDVDRFGFEVELFLLARKLEFTIQEVPVVWFDMPGSTVRPLADPLLMLFDLARVRFGSQARSVIGITFARQSGETPLDAASKQEALQSSLGPVWVIPVSSDETLCILPLSSGRHLEDARSAIREVDCIKSSEVEAYSMFELAQLVTGAQHSSR